ncbi:MAG: hypothetical protein ACREEM_17550 [Blastocatellia bacterium]
MATISEMTSNLATVFNPEQSQVLARVIHDAYDELVKTSDFRELKTTVQELADAQKRTEAKVSELADAQKRTEAKVSELADAQKRTEAKVSELADAQKRTEATMSELADAQKRTEAGMDELRQAMTQLAIESKNMRVELGGISNSLGYSLENEAYRKLPKYLKDNHGIEILERMIRREVAGEEINFFGRGRRNGKPVLVIGETKFRLTSGDFAQLDRKLDAVKQEYQSEEIVPLLVTHFATEREKERATNRGVIVAQSFEWD